jgi:parvulin-like peptidyl-prolyl isomerase
VVVDDAEVSHSHFARRLLQFLNRGGAAELATANPDVVAVRVGERMLTELILVERASELGVSVSDEEIDDVVRQSAAIGPQSSGEQFADAYQRLVADSYLKTDEYRFQIRASLLEDKVGQHLLGDQQTAPQRSLRMVRTNRLADAELAHQRLAAGESFASVSLALSDEPVSRYRGGEVPFSVRYELPEAIREAAFAMEPGVLSGIISPPNGALQYYIIQVVEADDAHPLTDHQRGLQGDELTAAWIDEQIAAGRTELILSADDRADAYADIRDRISIPLAR